MTDHPVCGPAGRKTSGWKIRKGGTHGYTAFRLDFCEGISYRRPVGHAEEA